MTMRCPVCRDRELLPVTVREITVDLCRACEGVWLQKGELERLLALEVRDVLASPVAVVWHGAPAADRADRSGGLDCPECTEPLRCYRYEGDDGIFVDGCSRGCGIWADDGELRKIHERVHRGDPLAGDGGALSVEKPGVLQRLAHHLLRIFEKD